MKKFRVTMMVPQERIMEGHTAQHVHNEVTKMLSQNVQTDYPHPSLHSIVELEETVIPFDPNFVAE